MSRAVSPAASRWRLTAAVAVLAAVGYLFALAALDTNGGIMGRLGDVATVLPVVIVGTIIACGLRAVRWLWLLSLCDHAVPMVEGLLGYLTGLAFTATPGKVGELVRVRYFRRLGVPHEQTVACFVFERVLDLLVLLAFASLLLGEKVGLSVAAGFVAVVISVVICIAWFPGLRRRIQHTLRVSGLRRMARCVRIAFRGIEQTRQFLRPARLVPAMLLGVLAWGAQCIGYALALLQLGIALPVSTLFAISPVAMLVGAASMVPGGVGTTEGATVALLLQFGAAVDIAFVGAIGIRLGSIWFSTIIGFMALLCLEWVAASKGRLGRTGRSTVGTRRGNPTCAKKLGLGGMRRRARSAACSIKSRGASRGSMLLAVMDSRAGTQSGKVSRGMLTGDNRQHPVQLALFLASLVILMTWVVPIAPIMPRPSLDPSWQLGMDYAVEHGWALGRDIIFTFGPLTSIFTHAYSPSTYPLVVAFSLVLAASFAIGLTRLFVAAPLLAIPLAVAMLIGVPQRDALFLAYPLLFYCVVRAEGGKSNALRSAMLVVLLTPALGILSVVKGTFAVCAAAFIILSALYLMSIRRALLAALICAVADGSMLLAWIATGQSASDIGAYLQEMATMIGGYSEAMAVSGPWLEVAAQGVGSLVVLATIIHANRKCWATVPVLLDLAAFGLFLFLCFKAGMVRHDGHAMIAAMGLLLVVALLLGHLREFALRHPARALGVAAVVLVIGCAIQSRYIGPKRALLSHAVGGAMRAYAIAARDLVTGGSKSEAYADALRAIATDHPVLPLTGTVDIYSFEQVKVIAAGMQWVPRPVFQSYAAYVPSLIEKNVAHLSGSWAPQNIIFAVQPIDGRYPSLDDGASWPTIRSRYHFSEYHRGFAYLKQRQSPAADASTQSVGSEQHQLGMEFDVPSDGGIVLARIDIEPTLLGRLLKFVFKPSQLHMTVTLSNGDVRTYRAISSMMRNPFVLSPLIDSTEDFALYLTGNDDKLAGTRVMRIRIDSAMSWLPLWQQRFTFSYSVQKPVKEPLPSSLFAAQFNGALDNVSAKGCNGNVELINNRPPGAVELSGPGHMVRSSGWLSTVDGSSTIVSRVLISLDFAGGTSEVYEARRTQRPDVALVLGNPALVDAGYEALIDLQGKPAIETLGVIAGSDDKLTKCGNLTVKRSPRH